MSFQLTLLEDSCHWYVCPTPEEFPFMETLKFVPEQMVAGPVAVPAVGGAVQILVFQFICIFGRLRLLPALKPVPVMVHPFEKSAYS